MTSHQLTVAYHEQIVNMPKRKPRSIRHHCRGRPSHAPPRSGTESLFDKSMRSLLLKSHSLQAETLKHVPKYYLARIYDAAKRQYVVAWLR